MEYFLFTHLYIYKFMMDLRDKQIQIGFKKVLDNQKALAEMMYNQFADEE